MLILKMQSSHFLTEIGSQASEARNISNRKCRALFLVESTNLDYLKISFKKMKKNPQNMSA